MAYRRRPRRLHRMALVPPILLAVLGLPGGSGWPGADRLSAIVARGELRVCSTGDYRPFTYRDAAGTWHGIDVEMVGEFARSLSVRPTFVATTWPALLSDFRARCDIGVGGVSVTLRRAQEAAFSIPYLADGKTSITRCADAAQYATLAQIDQPHVRVIVNPGGTNEQFAKSNLSNATLVEWPDNNTIFDQIAAHRADLMITDAAEARWQATRRTELCVPHPDRLFTHSDKAYLLPHGEHAFTRRVDAWLGAALRDGTFHRISQAWLR